MTGVGMYGVFIPDRFRQASCGANGKVSDWLGGGYVMEGGRGIYGVCRWDHCIDSVVISFP
jgi:hypothetical protein